MWKNAIGREAPKFIKHKNTKYLVNKAHFPHLELKQLLFIKTVQQVKKLNKEVLPLCLDQYNILLVLHKHSISQE